MRVTLAAAVLLLLSACALKPGEVDAMEVQLADEEVLHLMPSSIPAAFGLQNLSVKRSDDAVSAVTSFYRSGDTVISICATSEETLPGEDCVTSEHTLVERQTGQVTIGVACVSESCPEFEEQEWLSRFGQIEPSRGQAVAMIQANG